MSFSQENFINNQNESNSSASEEPKFLNDQRSGAEPSSELGTRLNEVTGTETFLNSGSAFRLNSSYTNNLIFAPYPQSRFSINEEESANNINQDDSAIFDVDEYYNYNDILNPYLHQIQQNMDLSIENIIDNFKTMLTNEKNCIQSDKEYASKQLKNFNNFKESYLKQYKEKKEELNQLFQSKIDLSTNYNINNKMNEDKNTTKNLFNNTIKVNKIPKVNKKDDIEIELSNNKIIKTKLSILKKYPNSTLAICFNGQNILPTKNNRTFLDREYEDFLLLLEYLENGVLPDFTNEIQEKNFFDELNYWKIPLEVSTVDTLKFDMSNCPNFFIVDKTQKILTKTNVFHGIVLLKKTLSAQNPYIEYTVTLNNPCSSNRKILFALVDSSKFKNSYLFQSFEGGVPFVFFWDTYSNKIYKQNGENFRSTDLNKSCQCHLNIREIKFGILYNHQTHSIQLFRNDINLGVIIKNIQPFLTPALEIRVEDCKIQLSSNNQYIPKFFL